MDAILQSVLERIEHTITSFEKAGRLPDRFENDYLAHALVCLSTDQYAAAHDHLIKEIGTNISGNHEHLTIEQHRSRFEEIKARLAA